MWTKAAVARLMEDTHVGYDTWKALCVEALECLPHGWAEGINVFLKSGLCFMSQRSITQMTIKRISALINYSNAQDDTQVNK